MNLLLFGPVCSVLCGMLSVDSMSIRLNSIFKRADQSIPLNMAEQSVDDMYEGCREMMADKVQKTFFIKENTGLFEKVWNKAEKCANDRLMRKDPEDQALTKKHMQAICAYTDNDLYSTFNKHVREDKTKYGSVFPFHSLHFWLTSAVQILNQNKKCQITYRRTNLEFNGSINQIIRFGYFASSSYKTTLTKFGTKTCFKIKTCSGGYLKHYSVFKEEEEVLIPPYEMFMITNNKEKMNDCKTVYTLESVGVHSNLNCKAVK